MTSKHREYNTYQRSVINAHACSPPLLVLRIAYTTPLTRATSRARAAKPRRGARREASRERVRPRFGSREDAKHAGCPGKIGFAILMRHRPSGMRSAANVRAWSYPDVLQQHKRFAMNRRTRTLLRGFGPVVFVDGVRVAVVVLLRAQKASPNGHVLDARTFSRQNGRRNKETPLPPPHPPHPPHPPPPPPPPPPTHPSTTLFMAFLRCTPVGPVTCSSLR